MKASIEKVIAQINFESKMNGIPEDKEFIGTVTGFLNAIQKAY